MPNLPVVGSEGISHVTWIHIQCTYTMWVAKMRQYQSTVIETNRSLHGKRTIGLRVSDCPPFTVWWLLTRASALVLPFDGFFFDGFICQCWKHTDWWRCWKHWSVNLGQSSLLNIKYLESSIVTNTPNVEVNHSIRHPTSRIEGLDIRKAQCYGSLKHSAEWTYSAHILYLHIKVCSYVYR